MTIRVGLLGAGFIGALHAKNLANSSRFELTVVAEPNATNAAAVAGSTGARTVSDWRELLADDGIQAVVIASPAEDHPDQVVAFANAGKHVLCEKPLALSLADADRAVAAAGQAGTLLQVDFNRRLDPHYARLAESIRQGRIGEPMVVRITSRDPGLPPASYSRGAGKMFIDTSIHDFDMARFLCADEVVEVSAYAAALQDKLAQDAGDADTAIISLRYSSGAVGVIDNSRLATYGYDQRAEVLGTAGLASVDNVADTTTRLADATGFHEPPLPTFFPERYADSFRNALERFADAIELGSAVPSDGKDSRAALAIALAAQVSHLERRSVRLEELLSAVR